MRIEDLKIFVDVVRYHSMNIAADKNFTTPQNLSKIIKRMEDELSVILFNRSKKGSELTEEGERFYWHIVEVLGHYNNAILSIKNNRKTDQNNKLLAEKKIRILCTAGALSYAVMDAYNKIQIEKNNILLEEEEIGYYDSKKLVQYVNEKEFDVVVCLVLQKEIDFIVRSLPNYLMIHVIFDELVLVVSRKNVLANRSIILDSELRDLKMISFRKFVQTNDLIDLNINCRIMTNSHAKALEQVRHSESYCTLLFKSFCKINTIEFGENGDFKMIRLEKKLYGTYLIMVREECIIDSDIVQYAQILEKEFQN